MGYMNEKDPGVTEGQNPSLIYEYTAVLYQMYIVLTLNCKIVLSLLIAFSSMPKSAI
jgi:hypothetical protein